MELNTPLITLSGKQSGQSSWTIRNAVEGVQIFGGIGSGKTSGSGRMLALKYLQHGFGGLVLTAKPDEKNLWENYCKLTNRSNDLIIVEPNGKHRFNFLDYESKDNSTQNLVQVLKTVIHAGEDKAGDDPFWETALDMLISNTIDLCQLAYGRVSVQMMYDLLQVLPKPDTQNKSKDKKNQNAFEKAFDLTCQKVEKQVEAWEHKQDTDTLLHLQSDKIAYETLLCDEIPDARTLRFINQFFFETFLHLAEKTRSIVEFSFSGFLFNLLREPVYSLFCKQASTFTPEDCLNGKIIVLNLPVKLHHKVGRDCQILFKYIWQRAMEKRKVQENDRPVFLWADEAQNFLHAHDADYQATARSSRIATVYISQNLPNYHANMGGEKSSYRVQSFLGTLATKIFHANADVETNRYASELIGDGYFVDVSQSSTVAGQFSSTRSKSLKIERLVRPEAFASLKTGGQANNFHVEGYLHLQGNPLHDGRNHSKITFNQNYLSNQ